MKKTVGFVLRNGIEKLLRNKIEEAEYCACLLMEHTLKERKPNENIVMSPKQVEQFKEYCDKRVKERIPVQYILGEWDFYNLVGLKMKPPVLIPRPETEELVDFAIEVVGKTESKLRILDPCTGTGAIGLALLKHYQNATCTACDVSQKAVDLAKHNARITGLSSRYHVTHSCVSRLHQNADKNEYDLLVCNPPYILTSDMASLAPEVIDHEDALALDGGKDGYDVVRLIFSTATRLLRPGAHILMELDSKHPEHFQFQNLYSEEDFEFLEWRCDFSSLPRFVCLKRKKIS